MNQSSLLLTCLRRHARRPVISLLLLLFPLWAVQTRGATLYWDSDLTAAGNNATTGAGLGGPGPWDTGSSAWWNLSADVPWTNSFNNLAVFTGTAGTVTLGGPISAGGLTFNVSDYTIGSNVLTLGGTAEIKVAELGDRATISSQISGTNGLYKTGNGVLVLSNTANDFTGNVRINQGGLVITDQAQLGNTGLVYVNGFSAANYSGGSLILQGGLTGMNFSKNLSLAGRSLNYANASTAALVSIGYNNNISSNISFSNGSATTLANNYGNLTLSGIINIPSSNTASFVGNGNIIISGVVTGGAVSTDRFAKANTNLTSTLWLQNVNNNYVTDTRLDSGTIRVTSNAVLGLSTSATAIDFNNGTLEVLTDTPDFSNRKIRIRDNTTSSVLFVSRALGGSGLNQTVAFGDTTMNLNTGITINGRDGYNTSFGGGVTNIGAGGTGNFTFTNSSNGLFTVNTPNLWNQGDGTARTLTLQGNAETLLTGNIIRTGGGAHVFTKAGTGTVTIQGTAGTFTGSANVNAGTLAISAFGAINNGPSGALQLNGGALSYLGTPGTGAGETTSKSVNLTGTTGVGIILADQTGTSPTALVISNGVAATGVGSKTFFLGGNAASNVINQIAGVIQNNTTTGSTTLAANFAAAATTITLASVDGIVVGATISGTGIPAGATVTAINTGTKVVTISAGASAAGTAGAVITVAGVTNITSLTKIGSGTWLYNPSAASYVTTPATGVTVASGGAAQSNSFVVSSAAGLVVGQTVSGTNVPAGSIITAISGTTVTINTTIGTAIAAATALTFGSTGNFTGPVTVSGGTLQVRPSAGGVANGADVINNSSPVVFNVDTQNVNNVAGGTFEYQGSATAGTLTEAVGLLTPSAGLGVVRTTANGGIPTLSFGGYTTRTAGAVVNFQQGISTGIQFSAVPTAVSNGLVSGAYITDPPTGAIDFVATPAVNTNINALGAATAFPAATGSATANYLLSTSTTTTAAVAANSIRITGGASLTLGTGSLTLTSASANALGGILHDNAGGASTISGQNLLVSAANQELLVITGGAGGASNTLTISSVITGNNTTTAGTGGVTKAGDGTLVLSGANAFTGTTTINEGTIRLGSTGSLGATNAGLMIRQGATLDLNGFSIGTTTANGLNAFNGAGTITNGAASGTALLRFGNNNTGGLFTGLITDGATAKVALVKAGTGTTALIGANTFTGSMTIAAGNLDLPNIANIGVPSGIGAGDATSNATNAASLVFSGGSLRYVGSNPGGALTATQTPSVNINRLFTLAGNGGIYSFGSYGNINAAASRAGNNAALIFNNTADVAFSGAGTRTLTFGGDSTGDNEMRIRLRDNPNAGETLSVTKADAGLWILNPATANTYTGTTSINGGALQATDGLGIPTNSNMSFNGGVFQSMGSTPVVFSRTVGTGAGQVSWSVPNGSGPGSGGFSAGTTPLTVNLAGAPVWGSTVGFLGTGNLILSSTSAFADVTVAGDFGITAGLASASITTTAGSATATVGSTAGLTVGQIISGNANIPAGTYISAINNATQFTLSSGTSVLAGTAASTLTGGFRQIDVADNGATGMDFATVSGVISGTGGLGKIGAGTLIIGGANTYSGATGANGGVLIVQSIGAAAATATSLGTNVGGGPLNIGLGATSGAVMYVGVGETTTRAINLSGTTGGASIDSSGSGPLLLSTITNSVAGAKTLTLRGVNSDANTVSSNLNDNGGALSVAKADGGVWELTGTNGFTGNLSVNGGLLGVSSAAALGAAGTGAIVFSNGGIYSTNAASTLTITRPIQIASNTVATFTGSNPITVNSTTITGNTGNPWTISNTITLPNVLTITSNFASAEAATQARTLAITGFGDTILSGILQSTGATNGGVGLIISTGNGATTTVTGASPNLLSGASEIRTGTLVLDKAGALGIAAGSLTLNGGVLRSTNSAYTTGANALPMPVILGGSPATINGTASIAFPGGLTNSAGNRILQNDISGGSLTFGAISLSNDNTGRTLTLSGSGTTNITGIIGNGGTAAGAFTYLGNGALNLTGANTFTGAVTFSGGVTTVSGAGTLGTVSGITVNQATLTLDNTTTAASRLGSKPLVLNGATLSLIGNAAGITENASTLTVGAGGSVINSTVVAGTNTLNFTTLTINSGGFVNFTGGVGTATNKVLFSTAPTLTPATGGILARATVGGADFATYGANGIAAFTGYVTPANINTAAATDTLKLDATTTNGAVAASKTINALAFDTGAPTVSSGGSGSGIVLTLTSGGILVKAGTQTLAARTALGAEGAIHVAAGATLNLSGPLTGGSGMNKNLAGALNITVPQFYSGQTTLNGGTTTLSGGTNTLFPNQTLIVSPGTILDLNGNNQVVGAFGAGNIPGSGGTIRSTAAALFSNNGSAAYGGAITGAITMNKFGSSTLTAESPLAYTGDTWITGGSLTLRDNATLANTPAININFATLNLDSNANLQISNNNRVNDAAPITSRGGTITYQARFGTAGTETLGALTLAEGASTITVNAANNANSNALNFSADLTFASLASHVVGTTVNFTSNVGFAGSGNVNHLYFTTAPPTLSNGMLGAWAIANTTDFAGYDPILGVFAYGYGDSRGYDTTFAPGNVTQFINNATPTVNSLSALSTTTGALRLGGVSQNDVTFTNAANILNLETGGLLRSNQAAGSNIGTTGIRGHLTAGGGANAPVELVVYSAASGTLTSTATATTTTGSPVITTVPSVVGLAPGQTITNANFPAGTYIVSIDGPTQITVSQNATASGAGNQAIVTGRDNVVVNSVIEDNAAGGSVTLVKSGAGVLNLSANNTYTGGTVFNQGTVNLIGSGVVIPTGGITLSGATLVMNTNPGQIATSNSVTLNDSSTLTLVGNNSLVSLSFNNSGGTSNPTVNSGGALTLTGPAPISVVSNNVGSVPTIAGTLTLTPGTKTFSVGAIEIGGQIISTINPALNISALINSTGSTPIIKTGGGLLQFSNGGNTFYGGIDLQGGGLLVGASSTPGQGGSGLTSGPFGNGAITAASGTYFVTDGTRSIGNDIAFAGTPTFDSTANSVWTLTLNGQLTGAGLAGPTATINVGNPFLTVALLGKIPNIASITSFNKTGPGALIFNSTGYTGDFNASALGNASQISLLNDGDGTGSVQNITLGNVIFDAGILPSLVVGRAGGSIPFPAAANKILSPASISNLGLGITVANNNGYGLGVTGPVALTGLPVFTVNTATASNVTQGLYVSGNITGVGFVKTGAGTMVINNATPANNTFTGNVNINQGVVSVNSDAQLGNAANAVLLNPQTGTATLRATGTFTLARLIQLSNVTSTRAIEVTAGNTLTLSTAFDLNVGAGATATLAKNDMGTLVLAANNPSWTGGLTINQGAVLVNTAAASPAGTGVLLISPNASAVGAALQLAGGNTYSFPISLQGSNNVALGGINSMGQLQNLSGSNTFNGAIAVNFDAAIGASTGSQLTLGSTITVGNQVAGRQLNFVAFGDIIFGSGSSVSGNTFGIGKYGSGMLDIRVPLGTTTGTAGITVRNGTLRLSGTGATNTSGAPTVVYGGATIQLDNSGTNTNNRLTARAVTLQGGTFSLVSNNSTETAGAFISDQGANTISMTGTGTSALTFSTLTQNAGSSLNLTGAFGTATNSVKFTTAPTLTPASTGILNRITTNGNEFATYGANGIVPFTGYSTATNILSATTTATFKATTSTLNSLTGNATLNALTINNTAAVGGLGGNPPSALTLTSGSILANGTGGAFLNVPIVTFGSEAIVHVASGQTLTVNSGFNGATGLSKDLGGTLVFNAQQFVSGVTYVNGGTVKLSGGNNTLLFNNAVAVNSGGTLDLNGNSQFMAGLSSATAGGSSGIAGGSVTNSGATQSTLTINGNTNFAGVISGDIYLHKTGTGALNLQQQQTYTGPTLITGGTVTLADNGALPNTSQPIDIRYGTLSLTNGNLYALGNRVSDTAPINLTGGIIGFTGRAQDNSTETLGAINLLGGYNSIQATAGGTNVNSAILTIDSITRTGTTSVLRFNTLASLGQIGSSANVRISGTAPTLTNNILGPWAIVDREYASYDATYGIGGLNAVGFAGYAGSGLNSGPLAADNVRLATAGGTTTMLTNTVVNTLNVAQATASAILDLGGNTLRLQGGGLLLGQSTASTTLTLQNGTITSGTVGSPSDLYLIHGSFADDRTATITAVIADNGVGGAVRLVYSGGDNRTAAGGLILGGTNSYTGGTVLNTSTLTVGATGTLGSGGISVYQGTLVQTAGGVIPSQALTLYGGATVTLAGNNSLTTLSINNAGGAAPTLTPTGILTLTGAGGIAVTTSNPGTIATIGTGTIDLNANAAYPISVGAAVINGVDVAPWQAGLNITALVQNGGITKSGLGLLQLSNNLNTFAGGVNVTAGGLVIGASSVGPNFGDTLTSGPLGTGTVTMAANTTLVSTGAFSVTNDFVFQGNTVFNGTNSLTLNGNTILPSTWNVTVTAPQMTVSIVNVINSLSSDEINKSGLGTLTVGNYNGTINIAGGLIFLADGNEFGTPENLALGSTINLTADTSITVNRSGAAPNARNKTIQQASLTNNGSILAVNNLNGYGLEITGATSLTGASHFAVSNASASNVVQGLTLSGVVSDTGGYSLVKSGLGTLALTNAGNTFGGLGATIDILNGILSASSDGALGNINNSVTLDVDATTNVGFRATGTFSTARTFILNQPNNAFEVTQGNVFTITAPLSVSTAANALIKNDNGVLGLNGSNSGWAGAITINAGAIRAGNASALGSGTVTIANGTGAALQLTGGVNVAAPLTLTVTATGINNGGMLQSVAGSNTYSGTLTQIAGTAITIGANAGASLDITGTITSPGANSISFAGDGNITLNNASSLTNGTGFNKLGNGTLTINSANASLAAAQPISLFDGTTVLASAGTLGPAGASTGSLTMEVGSTLTVDNSGTAVSNRLGTTRGIIIRGGSLNLIGNATTTTTETFALPAFGRGYSVVTVTAQPGAGANLVFTASTATQGLASSQNNGTAPTGASVLFRGTNLGQAAGNGVATIADTGSTSGFTFNGQSGANGTSTKGILPWALVDTTATGNGVSFATGNVATANTFTVSTLRPLAANEYGTTNAVASNTNVLLQATATNIAAAVTLNSITFDPAVQSTVNLTMGAGVLTSLSSGGILVRTGATSTISGGVLNQTAGFSPLTIWTLGDLTISSVINGGNGIANGNVGFVKAGAGTLTLTPALATISGLTAIGVNTMSGQLVINGGTLKLNGGKNTIQANNYLSLNNGTLDLNGTSQQILSLFGDNTVENGGGIVTSTTGVGNLVTNLDGNRSFAGALQGNLKLTRSGLGTWTLYSANTHTGSTLLNGSTTSLRDGASFSNTSSLDVNFAALTLDNTGTKDLTDRINDSAAITLRGGSLTLNGRAQSASSETLGAVTFAQGLSTITVTPGGTGVNSAELNLASLNRAVGGGTVNFSGVNMGLIGSFPRITAAAINGVSTAAVGNGFLTNDIIGGWATINTSDFATYIPGLGVGALGQAGFAQYSPKILSNAGVSTDNIKVGYTGASNLTVNTTINSVKFDNVVIGGVNVSAGTTLTLGSGGFLNFTSTAWNFGSVVNQGSLTSGGSELFIYTQGNGTPTINTVITGSGMNLIKSGGNTLTLAATNTYDGGTTVNQGTLNIAVTGLIPLAATASRGLVINNATVTANASGAIASGNIVTVNGGGALNLYGNNTLQGLVFNNVGGSANPTVNTFLSTATAGAGAVGILTIGSDGIVATSSNVGTTSVVVGRVDFGSSVKTINVDTINANGENDIVPLQAALGLQGIVGSTGRLNKTGPGVFQFNAQNAFVGPFNVTAGGIKNGAANAGSRFSALTLAAGTRYDLNNLSTAWGSLAGSGTVFSYQGTPILTVGFDNTSTTFSGQFTRFNAAAPNAVLLTKIGTGTLTLDSVQDPTTGSSGNITVNGGVLSYSGAGKAFASVPTATAAASAVTFTVNTAGTLTLDNSGTNVNNRLSLNNAAGTFNLQGGTLAITGNSGANTTELINALNVQNGGGFLTLLPDPARQTNVTITTLNTGNSTGSAVFRGLSSTAVNGGATLTITTPSLITNQGTGANGTKTMGIRHDILGDTSATGSGTGFLVRDSVSTFWRPMVAGEIENTVANWADNINAGVTASTATILSNRVANSLTFSGAATISSGLDTTVFGLYGPGGSLLTMQLTDASAALVLDGSTTTINVGSFTSGSGITGYVHVLGAGVMNVNGFFGVGGSSGFVKAGTGTLNLNNRSYYTGGNTTVNGGTLNLNSGVDNTLAVSPGATTPAVTALQVNAGTVDLKGNSQTVGSITSNNPIPATGGAITNSSLTTAMLTSTGGGTFGGTINGNLGFTRAGATATLLTSANTYTGATIIRGGTLQLRDSGAISSTAGLIINYGTLQWDNYGLNPLGNANPTRVAATNAVTLLGGTFRVDGAGSTDTTATLNSVTVLGGQNGLDTRPYINESSTVRLTIGNLVRNTGNHSVINFNGFSQLNSSGGASTTGGQGLNNTSNIILNQVNGAAFSSANLTNGLIGGWAVADGSTFATYVDGFGVSVMGQTTNGIVAPGFTSTDITTGTALQNVNDAGTARTITGAHTVNSWRSSSNTATTYTLSAASSLNLGVGWITNSNAAYILQGADNTSTITGSGSDLYVFVNQNTTSINAKITGAVALVKGGGATLALGSPTTAAGANNDYTGGTFVQAGTMTLNGAVGSVLIPGDLTINNATVTMNTNAGQIASTANIFINGGSTLTLVGTNTLNSVAFSNDGGAGNPTLAVGAALTLAAPNAVTVINDSFATTPLISGTALVLSNAAPVIDVSGLSVNGLQISAPITGAGGVISKTGSGALSLSGANTFTTGFNLDAGSLIFAVGTTGAVTNGPVGTGTLTIAGGTSVLSDGTIRTIANATTVNGSFTFGGAFVGNGVIFSGAMNLGAANRTITVTSPAVTSTISGAITSTATGTALTKAGNGTLLLSSAANNFGGAGVVVSAGLLKIGVANAIPGSSPLRVDAAAGFDLNGFSQTIDAITGAGFITNSANSAQTLTLGGTVASSTFDGVLTDNILAQTSSRLNLVKNGSGTQVLTNSNTYNGITTINGGVLQVSVLANGGLASGIGLSANAAANLVVNGGSLRYAGTGAANGTTDRQFTIGTSGATLDASGAAGSPMVFNSPTGPAQPTPATPRTLTLTGSNTDANTFSSPLANAGAGLTALTKAGAGTWLLMGTNTYTGDTNINGGVLQVGSNGVGSLSSSGTVRVNNTGTLSGSGSVGSTILGSGAFLTPGDATPAISNKTLTFTAVTLQTGSNTTLSITSAQTASAGDRSTILGSLANNTYNGIENVITTPNLEAYNAGIGAGASNDLLNITGNFSMTLGATITISDNGFLASSPAVGSIFNLIDWGTITAGTTFNSGTNYRSGGNGGGDLYLPDLATYGLGWDVSAFATHGILVVVPEPGRMLLLLLGLAGLFFRRRRRSL